MPAASASSSPVHERSTAGSLPDECTLEMLSLVWEQQQARVWERIERIGSALDTLARAHPDLERHSEAVRAAHMLAGSLGMFGLMDASEAARRIEYGLENPATADVPVLIQQFGKLRGGVRDTVSIGSA